MAKYDAGNFAPVSPNYEEACQDVTSTRGFSGALTFFALCDVIRRDIISVYPRVNGPLDMAARILDTTFSPQEKLFRDPLFIMWTSTSAPQLDMTWTANHFVPLVDGNTTPVVIVSNDEDELRTTTDDLTSVRLVISVFKTKNSLYVF